MSTPRFACMSYSFLHTFRDDRMNLDGFLQWCADRGFEAADPWGEHLYPFRNLSSEAFQAKGDVDLALNDQDTAALDDAKALAARHRMALACCAPDQQTYIYDDEPWKRDLQRRLAKRWIDAGQRLGVSQMRFDPGLVYKEDVPHDVMAIILDGYRDLVGYAKERNIEILIENHWGCAGYPKVVEHILDHVDGLGLLFDTFNFAPGHQGDGWIRLAPRARALHVKCARWADDGEKLTQHIGHAVRLLVDSGYDGLWGIEAMTQDKDISEAECVLRTKALIEKWHG